MFKWGLAQKGKVGLTFSNQSINVIHHIKQRRTAYDNFNTLKINK